MNRASPATGWVRNPVMKSPELDPTQASSYDLGWTYNPLTGCLNHTNGMCKGGSFPCYAYKLANGRLRSRYLANWKNIAPVNNPDSFKQANDALNDPFYPRFWEDRLITPARGLSNYLRTKPKGIFVCDMSDLFGIGIPEEWTRQVLRACEYNHSDRFYLLTKQPQNLIKFEFPDNCWVGVSATGNAMFWKALSYLKDIKATIKYLSIEPYLEAIKPMLSPFTNFELSYEAGIDKIADSLKLASINQVIIGSQTKPYKPPKISWVEEIVQAADKAGVKVFLKDNLNPLLTSELHKGMDIELLNSLLPIANPQGEGWEGKLRVLRQEIPG